MASIELIFNEELQRYSCGTTSLGVSLFEEFCDLR